MPAYRVAVVGATGLAGEQLLRVLEERDFPVRDLRALASQRSAGRSVRFHGDEVQVEPVSADAFRGTDLAFFAIGTGASRTWVPRAVEAGAVVIDKSNAFRMDPQVPLVIPEVNPEAVAGHRGVIASPNCSSTQLAVVLHVLRSLARLQRVIVSTYQSVSGSGAEALRELEEQVGGGQRAQAYPHPIAFNVLPHCDGFEQDGYTREELKLVRECRKILDDPDLRISATAARVPVRVGHSEAVLVEFARSVEPAAVRRALSGAQGVRVLDAPEEAVYPTALQADGDDGVLVGRIRRDLSDACGVWLWIVSDNLRKGAATNAVQVAELLHARAPVS